MKSTVLAFLLFLPLLIFGQTIEGENAFLGRLTAGGQLPEKLLMTRSAVFYTYTFTSKELATIQKSFQQSGIDAVVYFETDLLVAGKDPAFSLATYLARRDITNLIIFQKDAGGYKVFITPFNVKDNFVEQNQYAWSGTDKVLDDLVKKIYLASSRLKRENLLINDYPETELTIDPIKGRRSEFFAIDLKVDQLAVPRTGDGEKDKILEELFTNWPYKYKLTESGILERDLRKQGFLYVLCFIHTRGSVAKNLLGYETKDSETAIASVTYPNGLPQVKNIPADARVYKFYFKHIDSGNVFLGTKWDADTTWDQALKNHLMAFKSELKIN